MTAPTAEDVAAAMVSLADDLDRIAAENAASATNLHERHAVANAHYFDGLRDRGRSAATDIRLVLEGMGLLPEGTTP